jgi:hypothetical protein
MMRTLLYSMEQSSSFKAAVPSANLIILQLLWITKVQFSAHHWALSWALSLCIKIYINIILSFVLRSPKMLSSLHIFLLKRYMYISSHLYMLHLHLYRHLIIQIMSGKWYQHEVRLKVVIPGRGLQMFGKNVSPPLVPRWCDLHVPPKHLQGFSRL